ncbi:hypothetical protein H4582DRAFT_233775 [Lactarius indigo]|nr:hypothetical protein H4582DRAFT_233775 [Lactarius indigo]
MRTTAHQQCSSGRRLTGEALGIVTTAVRREIGANRRRTPRFLRRVCTVIQHSRLVVEDTLLPGVWIMDGQELVEDKPSLHNSGAVTQGVRACWWCHHSRHSEGACKAQLSAPASPARRSRGLPLSLIIIHPLCGLYRVHSPTPKSYLYQLTVVHVHG